MLRQQGIPAEITRSVNSRTSTARDKPIARPSLRVTKTSSCVTTLRLPAKPAARQELTMHNRKTRTTGSERRRFLDASWSGVAGKLA